METERPSSAPPGIDPAAGAQQQPGIMHHPGQDNLGPRALELLNQPAGNIARHQSLGGYGKRARESRLGNLTLQNAPKKHRTQEDETGADEYSSSEEFTTEYEVSDADTIRTGPTQPRQVYIQPAKLQVGDPMGPPPVPVPAIRVNPGTPNVVITRTTQDAISPRQRDDTIRPVNAIMIERPKQTTATSSYSDYPTVYQRTAALGAMGSSAYSRPKQPKQPGAIISTPAFRSLFAKTIQNTPAHERDRRQQSGNPGYPRRGGPPGGDDGDDDDDDEVTSHSTDIDMDREPGLLQTFKHIAKPVKLLANPEKRDLVASRRKIAEHLNRITPASVQTALDYNLQGMAGELS